jgi:polysaccharide biosynthesis/export protein
MPKHYHFSFPVQRHVPARPKWRQTPVRLLVLLVLQVFSTAAPATADYIIRPGDVLDISVLGAPALHRRSPVDPAGQITLPVIGSVDAADNSVSRLRENIQNVLVEKNIMHDPQITVEVVEYRPIFVGGDVTKPGAYTYRIGMTVRDAVALAEGYDLMHLRAGSPRVEAADVRSDRDASEREIAKVWARLARLQAELSEANPITVQPPTDVSIKTATWNEIIRLEQQQLDIDRQDDEREVAYLKQMVNQTERQSAALAEQKRESEAALKQQTANSLRARQLLSQGVISTSRFDDQQRAMSTTQNQLYDVTVRATQAQKDSEEFTRKLEAVGARKRIKLLQEISESNNLLATARLHLKAASEKLRFAGDFLQNQESRAERAVITIHRKGEGDQDPIVADERTMLLPGDNIEIKLKSNNDGSSDTPAVSSAPAEPVIRPISPRRAVEEQPTISTGASLPTTSSRH